MAKFSLYNIPLKNLSQGKHTFEYELDRKFFEAIDGDEVKKGNVTVQLSVERTSSAFDFKFHIKGVVQIPCNRCLDDMNLDIDCHNHLIVKFGAEYSEENDEIVVIPEDDGEINIAWFLYEFIALNIPIKHVHEAGKCNKFMSTKLRKHSVGSVDADDDDAPEEDDEIDDTEINETTDPRWDALKGLNFEDNN